MARKKTFVTDAGIQDDPALSFLSVPWESGNGEPEKTPEPAAGGRTEENTHRPGPVRVEVKSRRVQLVMQPSLYARVKAASSRAGLSLNEYCHQVLADAVKSEEN